MKRLLITAPITLALVTGSSAKTFDEMEAEASNHGYNSAALVTCGDRLIVTATKLRAKLDKMYRDNPKWKNAYREGFESGSPPMVLPRPRRPKPATASSFAPSRVIVRRAETRRDQITRSRRTLSPLTSVPPAAKAYRG